MRIGLFTNNYRPLVNGLATSVESFAQAFRRAGHDVTVVAPRYPGGCPPEPGVLRVPGFRAPPHPAHPPPLGGGAGGGGAGGGRPLRVPGFRAPTPHAYVLPMAWWPGVGSAVAALQLDVFH